MAKKARSPVKAQRKGAGKAREKPARKAEEGAPLTLRGQAPALPAAARYDVAAAKYGAAAGGNEPEAAGKGAAKGKKPPKKRGKRGKAKDRAIPAAVPAAAPEPRQAALLTLTEPTGEVLDRLHGVVLSRRDVDPAISHSARLLARGPAKVAQKFGEEAVECLIEATLGNKDALVGESADVLYHLLVVWVSAGVSPKEVWAELQRREGVSGLVEKASRAKLLPRRLGLGTSKIP